MVTEYVKGLLIQDYSCVRATRMDMYDCRRYSVHDCKDEDTG
jgi:hypothetical protein